MLRENRTSVVVGAGCIGLSTALRLVQSGNSKVLILADRFSPHTTSDGAGAIFGPVALPETSDMNKIQRWSKMTWKWLEEIEREFGERSGIKLTDGVLYTNSCEPPAYLSELMPKYRRIEAEKFKAGFAYSSFMIHPTMLMHVLREEIERLGGQFQKKKVRALHDLDADIIVNCAGLSGGELFGDSSQYPTRGQTIKVYHPEIQTFTRAEVSSSESFYILPRPNGEIILGGTKTDNDWNQACDPLDVDQIYSVCCSLNPHVKQAKLLGTWAGLRPQRTAGPRVERDVKRTAKGALVFHNYGHGGSGHTLQWGCARDIVDLILNE